MILRYDRESYSFNEPTSSIAPTATNLRSLLQEVARESLVGRGTKTFNDLSRFMNLRSYWTAAKVELSQIQVRHNDFCLGILASYRRINQDSSSVQLIADGHEATLNFREGGWYAQIGGQSQVSTITFAKGEYLADIRTRHGDITDQITFMTNRRAISFGGNGGDGEDLSQPVNLSRRVVALVGTLHLGLQRLGTISISHNWEEVGPAVLLRALVDRQRASPLQNAADMALSKYDKVVQALMMDMTEDIFKRTLSFLVMG